MTAPGASTTPRVNVFRGLNEPIGQDVSSSDIAGGDMEGGRAPAGAAGGACTKRSETAAASRTVTAASPPELAGPLCTCDASLGTRIFLRALRYRSGDAGGCGEPEDLVSGSAWNCESITEKVGGERGLDSTALGFEGFDEDGGESMVGSAKADGSCVRACNSRTHVGMERLRLASGANIGPDGGLERIMSRNCTVADITTESSSAAAAVGFTSTSWAQTSRLKIQTQRGKHCSIRKP